MSVRDVTINLNDLYWLVDIQYGSNTLVGRFLRGNKIAKMKMVSNHKPYLLTTDPHVKTDSCVVEYKEIEIYDCLLQSKRKLLKACVREPRDIYDKNIIMGKARGLNRKWN